MNEFELKALAVCFNHDFAQALSFDGHTVDGTTIFRRWLRIYKERYALTWPETFRLEKQTNWYLNTLNAE